MKLSHAILVVALLCLGDVSTANTSDFPELICQFDKSTMIKEKLKKAQECINNGNYSGAKNYLNGVLKLDPNNAKAKELLAYLVDRMGASATMGELMAVIWENGPVTSSRQSNLRNLIADMKNVLSDAGVGNIILKNRNSIAIDCASVDCDYYDFLRHIPYAVNSYHGEYMMQYSWAEITTAALPRLG